MSKPSDKPKCLAVPGCELPAAKNPSTGVYRRECVEHVPPAKTLREQIAEGPRFEVAEDLATCLACGYPPGVVDKRTGICRPCWQCWRWSPTAEREFPR